VFLIGHSSDFGRWKTWHFNGAKWNDLTSVYFEVFPGPPWYWHVPLALTGFSSGDVWIAGRYDSTEVWGEAYRGYVQHRKPSGQWEGFRIPGALSLFAIGGNSSSDLWVGGLFGQTFHYDGSSWVERRIADSAMIVYIRTGPDGTVYASGWGKVGSGIEVQYFRWSGTQWEKIEERMSMNGGLGPEAGISFDVLGDGSLYSATGSYISRRVAQGAWTALYQDPATNLFSVASSGGYAFAFGRMRDGSEAAYFHDGARWGRINALREPESEVWYVWSSSTSSFFSGIESSTHGTLFPRTYIIRGK
jgi:hypothetical protein